MKRKLSVKRKTLFGDDLEQSKSKTWWLTPELEKLNKRKLTKHELTAVHTITRACTITLTNTTTGVNTITKTKLIILANTITGRNTIMWANTITRANTITPGRHRTGL